MTNISQKDIALLIHEMTHGKEGKELDVAIKDIVNFLSRARMLSKTSTIFEKLEEIIHNERHETAVKAFSAYPIPEKQKEELISLLKDKYKTKNIFFQEFVDPKILGGIRLEIGDEVIDLSLSKKIKKLQEYLNK